ANRNDRRATLAAVSQRRSDPPTERPSWKVRRQRGRRIRDARMKDGLPGRVDDLDFVAYDVRHRVPDERAVRIANKGYVRTRRAAHGIRRWLEQGERERAGGEDDDGRGEPRDREAARRFEGGRAGVRLIGRVNRAQQLEILLARHAGHHVVERGQARVLAAGLRDQRDERLGRRMVGAVGEAALVYIA